MKTLKKWLRRWPVWAALLFLLVLFIAPYQGSKQLSGSTYGRGPDGYGAWYASLQAGAKKAADGSGPLSSGPLAIERWQKPVGALPGEKTTLVQIYPDLVPDRLSPPLESWVNQGNTLIRLGIKTSITGAPFQSTLSSSAGAVRIETARRNADLVPDPPPQPGKYSEQSAQTPAPNPLPIARPKGSSSPEKLTALLNDRYGAVVWGYKVGAGRVIEASTPHLAANAYQSAPGNFAFLTELVQAAGQPIKIDEYLHGYRDPASKTSQAQSQDATKAKPGDLMAYLAQTPLLPIGVQSIILLLFLIWAKNRRFGAPQPVLPPRLDNSEVYIQALSTVLQKTGSSELILATVGKYEQQALQRALGLGEGLVDADRLVAAWTEQIGPPPAALQQFLRTKDRGRRLSEGDLLKWLQSLKLLRQQVKRHQGGGFG
jgi:hypothetical protein